MIVLVETRRDSAVLVSQLKVERPGAGELGAKVPSSRRPRDSDAAAWGIDSRLVVGRWSKCGVVMKREKALGPRQAVVASIEPLSRCVPGPVDENAGVAEVGRGHRQRTQRREDDQLDLLSVCRDVHHETLRDEQRDRVDRSRQRRPGWTRQTRRRSRLAGPRRGRRRGRPRGLIGVLLATPPSKRMRPSNSTGGSTAGMDAEASTAGTGSPADSRTSRSDNTSVATTCTGTAASSNRRYVRCAAMSCRNRSGAHSADRAPANARR